jgi:hypothetical protein
VLITADNDDDLDRVSGFVQLCKNSCGLADFACTGMQSAIMAGSAMQMLLQGISLEQAGCSRPAVTEKD